MAAAPSSLIAPKPLQYGGSRGRMNVPAARASKSMAGNPGGAGQGRGERNDAIQGVVRTVTHGGAGGDGGGRAPAGRPAGGEGGQRRGRAAAQARHADLQ